MNNQQLFISLLHRLGKYNDACVLYALLQMRSDEEECSTSTYGLAKKVMDGGISRTHVQRAFARLEKDGLIEVRTQPNYRTCVKVRREAVDALLRKPFSENMPGMREERFPYLEHCAAAAA